MSLSLKIKIASAVCAVAMVLVGLGGVLHHRQTAEDYRELLQRQQDLLAQGAAEALRDKIASHVASLQRDLALLDAEVFADAGRQQAFFRHVAGTRSFDELALIDRDGRLVASFPPLAPGSVVDLRDRDYFREVVQFRRTAVSSPLITRPRGSPVIAMAVPVLDDRGELIGVYAGGLDLRRWDAFGTLTSAPVGATGYFAVLSAQESGVFLAHPDREKLLTPVARDPLGAMLAGGSYRAATGRPVVGHAAVGATGWTLVAVMPAAEAWAPMHAAQQRLATGTLAIALALGVAVWVTTLWLLRPLGRLHRATLRLHGRPGAPLALQGMPDDEVGALAHDFSRLLAQLRDQQAAADAMHDASPVGLFRCNERGEVTHFNETFLAIVGRSAADVRAGWLHLLEGEDRVPDAAALAQAMGQPEPLGRRCWLRRRDGSRVRVLLQTAPIVVGDRVVGHAGAIDDITELDRQADLLRAAEEQYRSVLENLQEVVFQTDAMGCWTYLNPAWQEATGFLAAASLGESCVDFVHMDDRRRCARLLRALLAGEQEEDRLQLRFVHGSGGYRWFELRVRLQRDAGGQPIATFGTLTDVTVRHEAEQQQRLAASVFRHSHDGILMTDAGGTIIDANDAFVRVSGHLREGVVGRHAALLKSDRHDARFYRAMWRSVLRTGVWHGEIWTRRRDGAVVPQLLALSAVRTAEGRIGHFVGVFTDISHLKAQERQLQQLAHHDPLTRLPNRLLLVERIGQAIARARRAGGLMAVAYLDLDGFKQVNDSLGHEAGDRLLVEVAARLQASVRAGDTVARLGGDEFVLLLCGLQQREDVAGVLERTLAALREPVPLPGGSAQVAASIGVALPAPGIEDPDTLLRCADQAMYEAKRAGKGVYRLFDHELQRRQATLQDHAGKVREAVRRDELVLHFQPQVNLRTGRVVGAEALVRWQHPQRGLLLPGAFLPELNDAAVEAELGEWVIDTALRQAARWRAAGRALCVSVNVSAVHLEQPGFAERLRALLARHPQAAGLLAIEMLESAALRDLEGIGAVMRRCEAMGVQFALDDFGTGYSSLSHLRRVPVSTVKIDRSFVRDMLVDRDDLAIVRGVTAMSRALGCEVVAEGVESDAHLPVLLELGCELAQGFGIARPMPAGQLPDWLEDWEAQRRAQRRCAVEEPV